jgi:hypothetical protein
MVSVKFAGDERPDGRNGAAGRFRRALAELEKSWAVEAPGAPSIRGCRMDRGSAAPRCASAMGAARTIASRRLAHNPGGELEPAKFFLFFPA